MQDDEALARCLQAEELAGRGAAAALAADDVDLISPEAPVEMGPAGYDASARHLADGRGGEPKLTDEELAMILQQEEDRAEEAMLAQQQQDGRAERSQSAPSRTPSADLAWPAPAMTDEELARMLQEQEREEAMEDEAPPRPPTPPRPQPPPNSLFTVENLNKLGMSGAVVGCCSGLQLAALLGCGHTATWLCALSGGVFGQVTDNSRRRTGPESAHQDDDWYPGSDDEDMARGLDADTIEGNTIGHVYSAPAQTATPTSSASRSARGGGGGCEDDGKCMVCMETFVTGDALRTLPCLHRYHKRCIDEWLSRSPECPICKRDITSAPVIPNLAARSAARHDRGALSVGGQVARVRRLLGRHAAA